MTCTDLTQQHAKDLVVKHLEMILSIVNRLNYNSFLIRGWSMSILVITLWLTLKNTNVTLSQFYVILIPMVFGFMVLDSYYLWQERLFRAIYGDIRKKSETDFSMDTKKYSNKPEYRYRKALFSPTILIFYTIEIMIIILASSDLIHLITCLMSCISD